VTTLADGTFSAPEPIGTVEPVVPLKPEPKPGETPTEARKPEELFAEYKTTLDAQAKELKKLQETVSAYDEDRKRREADERLRSITQPEPQPEPQPVVPPAGPDDFDWGNPLKSIESRARKIAQEELEKKEKAQAEYQKKVYAETAARNFFSTKDRVYRSNPELFAGIESDVEAVITQGFRGGNINADAVGQDKTWETAAAMIAYEKGDIDRLMKVKRQKIEPMKDVASGAIPGQVKDQTKSAQTQNIELDEAAKEYMKQRGMTYEQALEAIRYARENAYSMTSPTTIGSR